MQTIDLRSDTVTRPCPEMRAAIAQAEVGDDVIDTDPTIEELQRLTAEVLGKEAAIYMPSGSMTNQIAVRIHCKPGDEFLCEEGCHIFNYEQAAFAQLSGVCPRTIRGEYGVLRPEQFHGTIRPINEHMTRTRLVCLENTHNRGAGRVQPYEYVEQITAWARDAGLQTHLDGARLFNAEATSGIPVDRWSQHFDTVSVCFSKGLGAPVGSCLAGSREMIQEARRHRKLFGGGMRQAGMIAAGALYALRHNRSRLVEDHHNARLLADAIGQCEGLQLRPEQVDSNIVIFEVDPAIGSAADVVTQLKQAGVLMLAVAPQLIRAVTHLDVSTAETQEAGQRIQQAVAALRGNAPVVN